MPIALPTTNPSPAPGATSHHPALLLLTNLKTRLLPLTSLAANLNFTTARGASAVAIRTSNPICFGFFLASLSPYTQAQIRTKKMMTDIVE